MKKTNTLIFCQYHSNRLNPGLGVRELVFLFKIRFYHFIFYQLLLFYIKVVILLFYTANLPDFNHYLRYISHFLLRAFGICLCHHVFGQCEVVRRWFSKTTDQFTVPSNYEDVNTPAPTPPRHTSLTMAEEQPVS